MCRPPASARSLHRFSAQGRMRSPSPNSISINLFKLLVAAARMRPDRKVILAEHGNFPSDNHIVDSVARLLGKEARFVPAGDVAKRSTPTRASSPSRM